MGYDLGYFDREDNRVEPIGDKPFAPKLLPMSSEQSVAHVPGMDQILLVGAAGFEPTTTTPPVWCATRLRYAPYQLGTVCSSRPGMIT